jgi:putative addiction module component (TIGR02574 family)
MSSTLAHLKNTLSSLPAEERAELAQYLLHSLDQEEEGARAQWLALAEQRLAQLCAGRIVGIPAEEVLQALSPLGLPQRMSAREAIRQAEALLPGQSVALGFDPRWQAIIAISKYIETDPEAVWDFIQKWGGHAQEDLRTAIATCVLEHLLEYHFGAFFSRVEERSERDAWFADTFLMCSKFGQAEELANAVRFNGLRQRLMDKC